MTLNSIYTTAAFSDVRCVEGAPFPELVVSCPYQCISDTDNQLRKYRFAGQLFFRFVEVLQQVKPKFFLLENVKMKQEYVDMIKDNVEWLEEEEDYYE